VSSSTFNGIEATANIGSIGISDADNKQPLPNLRYSIVRGVQLANEDTVLQLLGGMAKSGHQVRQVGAPIHHREAGHVLEDEDLRPNGGDDLRHHSQQIAVIRGATMEPRLRPGLAGWTSRENANGTPEPAEVKIAEIVHHDPAGRPDAIVGEDSATVLRRIEEEHMLEAGTGGSLGEPATPGADLQRGRLGWRALLSDRGEHLLRNGWRNGVTYRCNPLAVG